ncbi:hypothetical protein T265_05446 [Opisthorchis viverrini]|uniref:Uncharacterized protein n=1 Tax=Opisthorchis viverrini TaxID=6198 RepID=A0A074ZJN5_OPIVI|nr:hypothetical protein T265_05446 [Opisthorchis viverrini]KER27558.1 hypothetical protein T265_05446 [Opisthorchis viverrini]
MEWAPLMDIISCMKAFGEFPVYDTFLIRLLRTLRQPTVLSFFGLTRRDAGVGGLKGGNSRERLTLENHFPQRAYYIIFTNRTLHLPSPESGSNSNSVLRLNAQLCVLPTHTQTLHYLVFEGFVCAVVLVAFLASVMDSDLDDIQWSCGRIGEVGQIAMNAANIAASIFCHASSTCSLPPKYWFAVESCSAISDRYC